MPEDEEGWETVQRGGRMKARHSPSQKSLENLLVHGSGGKKDLTRSMSVPDSSIQEVKQTGIFTEQERKEEKKCLRTSSEQHLPEMRERLDSKGSEKENIPIFVTVENICSEDLKSLQSKSTNNDPSSPLLKTVKRNIFGVSKEKDKLGADNKVLNERVDVSDNESGGKTDDEDNLEEQLNSVS